MRRSIGSFLCAMCMGLSGVSLSRTLGARAAQGLSMDNAEGVPAVLHSGPYTPVTSTATLDVPQGAWGEPLTLNLYLSSPQRTSSMQPRSIPVVLMFNGFQFPAAYYAAYRRALSSWGYATLSYDLPGRLLKRIIRDDYEIQFIPLLLDWLHQQTMNPASPLYEVVDTKRVAGFGHSRGAKLAALAWSADGSPLQAAVLLDPVDLTPYTRSQGYPSAVDALAEEPRPALLIGAGVRGRCNPADEGWAKFWPVLSGGSWLHVLKPAGHNQFLDVKGVAAWGLDRLCGTGNITHQMAIHLAQGATIAWLQSVFRPSESEDLVGSYLSWVTDPQQVAFIDWTVKVQKPVDPVSSVVAGAAIATEDRQELVVAASR